MKAREIREKLQGKIDPVLLQTLEAQALEIGEIKKVIVTLTSMVNLTVETAEAFNMVAEGMKKKMTELEGLKPVDAITGEKH